MVLAINIAVKYSIMTPDGPRNAIAIVADTEQTVFSGGYSEQVLKEKWFIKRYEQLIELNADFNKYFRELKVLISKRRSRSLFIKEKAFPIPGTKYALSFTGLDAYRFRIHKRIFEMRTEDLTLESLCEVIAEEMISAEEIEIKKFKSSQDQSFLEFFNKDNRGEDFIRRYGFGKVLVARIESNIPELFEVRPDYSGSSNYICFERTENPFVIGVARQYALDFFKGNEKARFLRRHSTQQITAVEFDTVIRLLDDAIKEASKNGHGLINSHFSGANIIEGQFATKIESPVRFSLLAGTIKTRVGNVISTLHRFALMIAAACNSMNAISPQ